MQREIILPEREPPLEWILGKAVPKVGYEFPHATIQGELSSLLDVWAEGRGSVAISWTFRLGPPGEDIRPQVPDVAYLSYESMAKAKAEGKITSTRDLDVPLIPPNLAVEVLSPQDRKELIAEKTRVFLAAGTDLVLLADPDEQMIETHDGVGVKTYRSGQTFAHPKLPGFELNITALFETLDFPDWLGLPKDIPKSIKKKADNPTTRESRRRR
ncbi:MAG TPA: Uma2 family endonuclease [Candidatus Baltobacteraceae bacterium]|jgi:Uma2 family endonuclease|nr:Uma2 family endonuclease [Candidatus Baltobacteraceae bacterium]